MTPGWYPDQHDPDRLRWHDGGSWTNATLPAGGGEPTAPYTPAPTPSGASRRSTLVQPAPPDAGTDRSTDASPRPAWHTRWWAVGGVALVVGLLLGAVATGTRDLKDAARTPSAVATPAATVTATATVTASPSPASPDADGVSATFPMPDEVGQGLQDAQDDLQALSGRTFFHSGSSDASGQGRQQFFDADWRVCRQNVEPDTPVSVDDRSISFDVVRTDETCP